MSPIVTPPPPPPSPPSPSDQANNASNEKSQSFIKQWLAKNKHSLQNQNEKKRSILDECIFPPHVPLTAMCNVDPILSLFESQSIGKTNGIGSDGESMPTSRTTIDDVRQIAALCATYKSRALINHSEFRHKKELQQRKLHRSSLPKEETSQKTANEAPPYNPEYSPLDLRENFILSKVNIGNYKLCVARATCPKRTERLVSCWNGIDAKTMKKLEEQGAIEFVCRDEREAVERCVGLGVQRTVRDILG